MRFADLATGGDNPFTDVVADSWYYDYVVGSTQYGWITGYADGTFRPEAPITRAEVTAIVNRMLGRSADTAYALEHTSSLNQFNDLPSSHWAYWQVVEASNGHRYEKQEGLEVWTGLQ